MAPPDYVTKQLSCEIEASEGHVIVMGEPFAEDGNHNEILCEQSPELSSDNTRLTWVVDNPKIGVAYSVPISMRRSQ